MVRLHHLGSDHLHKILLLVGPTRAGKGVISRTCGKLIGSANVAGPTLSSLAGDFGLAPLLGKSLAVISDARLSGRGPQVVVLERLLSISGEDYITVNRKYREQWTGQLPTRFMLVSNELPQLGDASAAIANRFVPLLLDRSWLGREDRMLERELDLELPGILAWPLDVLYTLDLPLVARPGDLSLNPLTPILVLARRWIIDPHAHGPAYYAGGTSRLLIPIAIYVGVCALAVSVFRREAPRIAEEL
jgi:hypothetical protein